VYHPYRRFEAHGPYFFLNPPRYIAVLVCGVRKKAVKSPYGDKGRSAVGNIARQETPTIMVFNRVFINCRKRRRRRVARHAGEGWIYLKK
jgi:hypothetical protein